MSAWPAECTVGITSNGARSPPGFTLRIDPTEVAGTFEAPLRHLLDPGTHAPRVLRIGDEELTAYDLPWQEHTIWGATAGMLLTLKELLE